MKQERRIHIGVLGPGSTAVQEREFARLRPNGVSFRFGSFFYPKEAGEFCEALAMILVTPMRELVECGAELIFLGCTTASMVCANAWDETRLEQLAGVPVVTAASAVSEAIATLQLRSVAMASPYGESNNQIITDFLAARGVRVAALRALGLDRSLDVWREKAPALTPRDMLELGLSANVSDAQALYLPCTAVASLEALEALEQATGKLAFSSVQAGFWASLRRLGFDGSQLSNGRLLRVWDPAALQIAAAEREGTK